MLEGVTKDELRTAVDVLTKAADQLKASDLFVDGDELVGRDFVALDRARKVLGDMEIMSIAPARPASAEN